MLIQQALERLLVGRTTIIIAHRLSTIRSADAIAVLEGSRITEIGTHEELMKKGGLYSHLNKVQSQLNRVGKWYVSSAEWQCRYKTESGEFRP